MLTINGKRIFTSQQAVVLLFALALCDKLLVAVLGGFLESYGSWGFYIAEGLLLLLALPALLRAVQKWDIIAAFAWASLLLVNVLLLQKEQDAYLLRLVDVFLKCFPLYFIGKAAAHYTDDSITKSLQWIVVLSSVGYLVMSLRSGLDYGDKSYSQYMGYMLLPPACIALCFALKGKLVQIPFAVLLLYGVVASGARGPLFSMLLVGVVYVVGRMNNFSGKKIVGLSIIGLVITIVCLNFEAILESMFNFFESNGISIRVLNSLLEGTFTEDSARNQLYELSMQGALGHPLGVGIFHDRQYLQEAYKPADSSSGGYYPHNLFVEFFLQFGIIVGAVLVIALLVLLFRAYRNSRKKESAMLCLTVLFGVGLFPLMVSASYVEWTPFYLMMGYVVTLAQKRKPVSLQEMEDDTQAH